MAIQTLDDVGLGSTEEAGYFAVAGVHLYTMLHRAADPLARVLLVGSFAQERLVSYTAWIRWARYLAARRIECLRFDYRGIGESTGTFEEMGFDNWLEDVEVLARWMKDSRPDLPLFLHGLEMGAILAGKSFGAGMGDGLLLWAAPSNANQPLRATVLRCIAMDQVFKNGPRKPASDYFQKLESGVLDVDGYQWSSGLWNESFRFELPAGMIDPSGDPFADSRPVRTVMLDRHAAPLVHGASVDFDNLNRDFSQLFADNFEWIATAAGHSRVSAHARNGQSASARNGQSARARNGQ